MSNYDYQRHAVLFVEPSAEIRLYFNRLFSSRFRVFEAKTGGEALQRFREHAHEIAILIYEQGMTLRSDFRDIENIRQNFPNVICIASVEFLDVDLAIRAVSRSEIYRYLIKPWDVSEFEIALRNAMEMYIITAERDDLLKKLQEVQKPET